MSKKVEGLVIMLVSKKYDFIAPKNNYTELSFYKRFKNYRIEILINEVLSVADVSLIYKIGKEQYSNNKEVTIDYLCELMCVSDVYDSYLQETLFRDVIKKISNE